MWDFLKAPNLIAKEIVQRFAGCTIRTLRCFLDALCTFQYGEGGLVLLYVRYSCMICGHRWILICVRENICGEPVLVRGRIWRAHEPSAVYVLTLRRHRAQAVVGEARLQAAS